MSCFISQDNIFKTNKIHQLKYKKKDKKDTSYQVTLYTLIRDTLHASAGRYPFGSYIDMDVCMHSPGSTRVGTLIVATIYLQLIQNRYIFRSFTVLQCSHQHCVQPVASDVEVVGYL